MRTRLWWWVYGLSITLGLSIVLGGTPSFGLRLIVTVLVGSLGGFLIGVVGALRRER